MAADQTPAAVTAELAESLFTLTSMMADHVHGRLDELSLTMTLCCALRSIDGPTPMKEVANRMEIDPSQVTLVADNLEQLELVQRQQHPTDRRIKNLVLTERGEQIKKTIHRKLWTGSTTFSGLTDDDRAKLTDLLTKLISTSPQSDSASGAPHC